VKPAGVPIVSRTGFLQDLKLGVQIGRVMETSIGKLIVRGRDCRHNEQRLFRAVVSAPRARGPNRRALGQSEKPLTQRPRDHCALIPRNMATAPIGTVAMSVRQHPGRLLHRQPGRRR
jgi:hypothetical protein